MRVKGENLSSLDLAGCIGSGNLTQPWSTPILPPPSSSFSELVNKDPSLQPIVHASFLQSVGSETEGVKTEERVRLQDPA